MFQDTTDCHQLHTTDLLMMSTLNLNSMSLCLFDARVRGHIHVWCALALDDSMFTPDDSLFTLDDTLFTLLRHCVICVCHDTRREPRLSHHTFTGS